MEVKVYMDVLFIINFIIDYILILVTSFFLKRTPGIIRMFLSSSLGALFSTVVFFLPESAVFLAVSSVGVAVLMVFVSFGDKKARVLIKDSACFYLVSLTFSGIGFSMALSITPNKIALNNGIFYADCDAYTLLLGFFIAVFIIHTATGHIKKQKIKSNYLYDVVIEKNGKKITDTAFFDSGNFLTDAVSQKSVIVAEWQSVSPLFEEDRITDVIINHPKDFLYIGCKGLGDTFGLYAFSPDKVTSHGVDFFEPVLVAITEKPLDSDGSYRMILPNSLKIES